MPEHDELPEHIENAATVLARTRLATYGAYRRDDAAADNAAGWLKMEHAGDLSLEPLTDGELEIAWQRCESLVFAWA